MTETTELQAGQDWGFMRDESIDISWVGDFSILTVTFLHEEKGSWIFARERPAKISGTRLKKEVYGEGRLSYSWVYTFIEPWQAPALVDLGRELLADCWLLVD